MISGIDIYKALIADTDVTDNVSSVNSSPCIVVDNKEPDTWPVDGSGITIYQSGIEDNRLEYSDQPWTCNCRAVDYNTSRVLAGLVVTALNRKAINNIDGLAYCQTLQTIQPVDDSDNYNTPVEVQVKRSF